MKKGESNGLVNKTLILEAYTFLREKECTIPSETLDFMRIASLEKLKSLQSSPHEKENYPEAFVLWLSSEINRMVISKVSGEDSYIFNGKLFTLPKLLAYWKENINQK